ncbi:hypothetical protein AG1IA_10304 [Rhizoctonia solani AG-1 IA]|uniref:CFEM domain-containing protein n=1 Tax=Thanatephorus cucumeris (strain AG1-IA) TaxID=983506 RepID=L8WBV8_THACA|nr:hypothetical protein AG1IA_10304 [Rhizoctonia solani AG-1 IA]
MFKSWRRLPFLPPTPCWYAPCCFLGSITTMRVSVLFTLGLATSALGQAITSGTPDPTTTTIEFITDTDTETTITSTPTSTSSSTFPIASTAAPPVGGGATCVQRCLTEAADNVGCIGGADLTCVCASA